MLCSPPAALSRFVYLRNLSHSASLRLSKPCSSPSQRTLVFAPSRISSSPSRNLRGVGFPFPVSSSPAASPLFCRFASEMASKSSQATQTVHDFTVKDARGNDVDLSIYKGKVLLIVNVASQCGLTNSNYTDLTTLYEKYKDKGLEILAFPCNQFGAQEPGTNEQILEFACTRFKAEYPIFDKVDVNGNNAAPIYKFLKSSKGSLFGDSIKWNFSKFLVDKEGHVVDRYAPTTSPLSIEKDVKKLLGLN
ncbi:probable phospholipid hydroperoxide glutathione peroxidase [Phoenix dactylifera]|uniref:Glutathione peroxidase n=1 Tax=Phoenix dactylifera TaxID=42345 RepID=A0A8B7BF67_PHODC|nr:probable phospholipid hydroperoxide glutathione peroxidase [Phoenix dactylifera]